MTQREDLYQALRNANAAGDSAGAQKLAAYIQSLDAPASQTVKESPADTGGTLQFGPLDTGIKTPGWLDRGLAGVGKAFADTGRGIGQLTGQVSRDDVGEQRRLDAPLMDTTAGKVGNILGNVALLAPTAAIPGANTVTGAGVIGAATGFLQPSASTGETVTNTLFGGAGGAAGQRVANAIGNLASQGGNAITQGQRASAQGGQQLGMRLTPGKASGSTVLQKMEAAAESNPLTSGGFDAIKDVNQRAVNRAAARAIGENSDELSTPVLHAAEQRLGAVFNAVADRTPVRLDPQDVGTRLRQIVQDSDGLIGGNASLLDNPLIQRMDGFVNDAGGATREQLRTLSSKMGKAARNNMTTQAGDRELGQALFAAQEVVEDAIQNSLSGAQRAAYGEARGQYRNLMSLTAKNNVVNPSSGNVSGRSLANTLMQKDRGGFTMGGNNSDMYAAARFTQAFPDIVGNSGTATRSMGPADYLTGIPGNLLIRLYLSQPVTAAAAAGAGTAGTLARLANTPANALSRSIGSLGGLGIADLMQQQ